MKITKLAMKMYFYMIFLNEKSLTVIAQEALMDTGMIFENNRFNFQNEIFAERAQLFWERWPTRKSYNCSFVLSD